MEDQKGTADHPSGAGGFQQPQQHQQQQQPYPPPPDYYGQPPQYSSAFPTGPAAASPPPQIYPQYPGYQTVPPASVNITYAQQPQQQPQIVIHQMATNFGKHPITTNCHNCHSSVTTKVNSAAGPDATCWCIFMFIFGCWLCCCCPFCMESFQVHTHTCPQCNNIMGRSR